MTATNTTRWTVHTGDIAIEASLVPWDSDLFGFPVAQVDRIQIEAKTISRAQLEEAKLACRNWLEQNSIGLASARLPHDSVTEAFFLEDTGFRFIETVLHPCIDNLQDRNDLENHRLRVRAGTLEDLPQLTNAARNAFSNERFHVDPRLDDRRANNRYSFFVEHALKTDDQELLVVEEDEANVAFFVVQNRQEAAVHWYLTAVIPGNEGRGYGFRAWAAMLNHHRRQGVRNITTTIAARNNIVLGLYAKLDFRFLPAESTFHWVRG